MYKLINDIKRVNKQNIIIRDSILIKNSSLWMKKIYILDNNLIVFPTIEKIGSDFLKLFKLFKKITSDKYIVSGIDINRNEHIKIQSDPVIDSFFLAPNYLYEININSKFNIDILEPPHCYLISNLDFTFGYIYDNDSCGDYILFGKEKYWQLMFGKNFINYIVKRLDDYIILYENRKNSNKEVIKDYRDKKNYYESILKEQGYLK